MRPIIAVTGPRGLLGSTLIHVIPGAVPVDTDVRDENTLHTKLIQSKADWIIHTAAMTNVAACEQNPTEAFAVNAEGTRNVVDSARSLGARMIYISTSAVFSGNQGDYQETEVPDPINVYCRSKANGEQFVQLYEKGMIVRLNLIGIHPDKIRESNFIEWLIKSFNSNDNISLFDDVMINPLSSWTIARMISNIVSAGIAAPILHIASSDVKSKADIGEMCAHFFPQYTGLLKRVSVDSIADGVKRPKETWLNTDYTKRVLASTMPSLNEETKGIFSRVI